MKLMSIRPTPEGTALVVRYMLENKEEVEVVMRDDAVVVTHDPCTIPRVMPRGYQCQTVVAIR